MTDKIGFGILGCARIARNRVAPAIQRSDSARVVAVASSRPGVAAEWAKELETPKAYESYEAVLEDPAVRAVYIPATGDRHHPLTLLAAKAGKHVLCEKSLATSVREAEEMLAACQEAGVLLQEAFMWRHHPRTRRAKKMVASGEIGVLRIVCAKFSFDIDRSDWRLDPAKGGGAIWDIGCYGVNAARLFCGSEPETIHARAHFHETGVDMTMQIALAFPDGVLANIDCSFESAYRAEVELVGTQGRIVLPRAFGPPEEAEMLINEGTQGHQAPIKIHFPKANQYTLMVDDFCAAMTQGMLHPPAEDGLANMRVLEEALRQAKAA